MNTSKLVEALQELRNQKLLIEQAITNIEQVIASLSGNGVVPIGNSESANHWAAIKSRARRGRRPSTEGSHLMNAILAIKDAGKPLHISEIVQRINEMTGTSTNEASLVGALSRDIKKFGANARVKRISAGLFALNSEESATPPGNLP